MVFILSARPSIWKWKCLVQVGLPAIYPDTAIQIANASARYTLRTPYFPKHLSTKMQMQTSPSSSFPGKQRLRNYRIYNICSTNTFSIQYLFNGKQKCYICI